MDEFFKQLPEYIQHIGRIRYQYRELKKLGKNLTEDNVCMQIDFSENYACKNYHEIQFSFLC